MSDTAPAPPEKTTALIRKFLLVVDSSAELRAAVRFACRRALHTGGVVVLFYNVPQRDSHYFATIGELMEREARNEAEEVLKAVAGEVYRQTGTYPLVILREGDTMEQLLAVIHDDPTISVLVLGAGTGPEGPGVLVSGLSGKLAGKIRIPVTIVPGHLSDQQVDNLT
ncbi:MAG: universal stress protein [Rhodospirillaceae bacterium]|nr:universal stress protein [Rhodospirillaceae bacterium]